MLESLVDNHYVTFHLGDEEYGIPIDRIQEVIQITEITPVPHSPDHMAGVMNMREQIIPMLDLAQKFGMVSNVELSEKRAVVVKQNDKPLGLIVDKINKVIELRGEIEPPPPTIKGVNAGNIIGIGKLDNRFIILLNLDSILSGETFDGIAPEQTP